MRRLKKPPRRLRIDPSDAIDEAGNVVRWGSTAVTKRFRQEFSLWARRNQKGRCAYCSLTLGRQGRRSSSVDHFVRKGGADGVPQWTYELLNLLLACEQCNSKLKKQFLALDGLPLEPYRRNAFHIVHPYLDKVDEHIKGGYSGGAAKPTTPRDLTPKGAESIRLFGLAEVGIRQLWEMESQARIDEKRRRDLSASDYARYREALAELQGAFR